MTAKADEIIERRRIRRRLALWRILAIVAVVVAIILALPKSALAPGAHVARVSITGLIRHDPLRERAILDLVEMDTAKAVIVTIDSRGGTLVGSEALYDALRKVAEEKPVVAVMSEYAASGGYVVALASDQIIARRNTLTGSIGVVLMAPNIEGLLDMAGVEVNQVKSAPLKAEPSMVIAPSQEVLQAQQEIIDDGFDWFRGLVADRRGLNGAKLDVVTDGRVFTGKQALDLGLVDALGDEATARDWLAEMHGIDTDLKAVDVSWTDPDVPFPLQGVAPPGLSMVEIERLLWGVPRLSAVIQ